MKNITTIPEALKRVDFLLKNTSEAFKLKSEVTEEEIILEEWLYITPFETEEAIKTIAGEKKQMTIHYEIGKLVCHHGVHYYPDGGGQPDDWDVEPVKTCKTPYEVVKEIMRLWMDNHVDCTLEQICEQEEQEEIQREENEMERELTH